MMKILCALGLLAVVVQTGIAQTSPHGKITIECGNCHGTDSWKMKSDAQFSHTTTGFDLTGVHKNLECRTCHEGLKFTGVKPNCESCHTDIHTGELGPNCLRCHTTQVWKITDMIQRHQQTRFPLIGRHAAASCESCHAQYASQQYRGTPVTCIGCHRNDYLNSRNPNHTIAGFSTECTLCHSVTATSWGSGFDHQATAFPLTGAHRAVQCSLCHTSNTFKTTPQDCYACHGANFNTTQNPNHLAGKFSHHCGTCHTTNAWVPSTFSHSITPFSLVGAHQAVPCASCHVNNVFGGLHQNCFDCHQTDFNTAANHVAGKFSAGCTTCHSMNAWSPASFDHSATKFVLTGKHTTVQCQDCHTNGNYQLVYSNCYQCHQPDFTKAVNPNHTSGNFSHSCETCHSTTAWSPATFDHSTTKFALTGKHTTTQCQDCHTSGNYQLAYSNCYQCHQTDFTTAASPNHVSGNFSHSCETCHTTTGWSPAAFDHSTTKFTLTGKHTTIQCQDCHTNGNYQLVYAGCFTCHQADFQKTTNPSHRAGNFSHTCEQCHTTTVWTPSTFNHANTPFPLVGAHQAVPCVSCHVNNVYAGLHQNCIDCHQTDFNTAANPNHVGGNFSAICTTCHSLNAWSPASFDHSITKFALTGTHTTLPCQNCHTSGNYQLTYSGCYPCHQSDYQSATNPNHSTGYPQTCDSYQCHSTASWTTSSFNHDTQFFKIYSGKHRGRWTTCVQCHQVPADLSSFTCTAGCHSKSQTDGDHRGVSGYVYTPTSCYNCHRTV